MNKEQAKYLFYNPNKLRSLKRYKSDVYNNIVSMTSFLTENSLLKARLWHIMHNINHIIKCKMCENPVKWDDAAKSSEQSYRTYCSHKCMASDPEYQEKRYKTIKERYGDGLKEIVKKAQETNLTRYGCKSPMSTEKVKQKRNNTCLNKYGVDNPSKVKEFMEARKNTNLKKFGYEHASQSPICKESAKQTYIEKYNVEHISHRTLSKDTIEKLKNKIWLKNEHHNKNKTVSQIAEELNINTSAVCRYFHKYSIEILNFNTSKQQTEIENFLTSIGIEFKHNDKQILKGKEIDILIPTHNLAIEVNGNYWHSELQGRGKEYHLDKTNRCKEQDIQLIHVLESEWILQQDIIKSRLSNLLGKNTKIFARKCKIVNVTKNTKVNFLREHHLQGNVGSKINYGLVYNDELVGLMTFGIPRFSKKYEYELLRFVTKRNTNIVGGASKLFKHFIKEMKPQSVISYGDLRYGKGNLYKNLEFTFLYNSKPNYSYFYKSNTLKLYSRLKFQKYKLEKLLETFDQNLTAWQNMVNNGYNRIWDCGSSVWLWENE